MFGSVGFVQYACRSGQFRLHKIDILRNIQNDNKNNICFNGLTFGSTCLSSIWNNYDCKKIIIIVIIIIGYWRCSLCKSSSLSYQCCNSLLSIYCSSVVQ